LWGGRKPAAAPQAARQLPDHFDVAHYPSELFLVTNEMVIAFILSKGPFSLRQLQIFDFFHYGFRLVGFTLGH
jgi:hypothetical protein